MKTIDVEIFAGPVKIGTTQLSGGDYGMAVASGDFIAADAYSAVDHAIIIEGERSAELATPLEARTMAGELIPCWLVAVTDYAKTVGPDGRIVELFGIDLAHYFGPEPMF